MLSPQFWARCIVRARSVLGLSAAPQGQRGLFLWPPFHRSGLGSPGEVAEELEFEWQPNSRAHVLTLFPPHDLGSSGTSAPF